MALTQVNPALLTGSSNTTTTIQSNGTTAITIDSSQNVGIGTTGITGKFHVAQTGGDLTTTFQAATNAYAVNINLLGNDASGSRYNNITSKYGSTEQWYIGGNGSDATIAFRTGSASTERMRIDSSGNLLVGVTSSPLTSTAVFYFDGNSRQGLLIKNTANSQNGAAVRFMDYLGNVSGGGIYYTSSNAITYATSSDYRLKENIAPMNGALAKVEQLKPCTFKWKVDGSNSQGFIAHELQEVVPECVTGTKDAVDEEGNPRYQGIDTSFLVATLTAAIQELKAINDQQAETIAQLQADVAALKAK